MASIGSLNGNAATYAGIGSSRPAANAGAELAKLETQLSDWVHCPSCKTSTGKAKIAEITDKIDAIKVQVKKAEDAKVTKLSETQTLAGQAGAPQGLRFDGLGSRVDVQV